jgi:hypothetical protein
MDIDRARRELAARFAGKDLHIARENHQLGT